MTDLDGLVPELLELLSTTTRDSHVPGAALAVSLGDQVIELATGVLNVNTGVAATPDSLFQIGSITKTLTTTLVMQLVDAGLVGLEEPVVKYVPEFAVADSEATASVTVRQLLSHTGGFEGDVFDDFGRGDDCLTRYVAALGNQGQLYPPGEMFSYCNSGFCVLGRLVERARELPNWEAALREHLIKPLGLTHTASLPEEILLFRNAVGHMNEQDPADQQVVGAMLPRSSAPAGATTSARARDLLAFARMHMRGGLAEGGARVLSAESVAAMQEQQVEVFGSGGMLGTGWGLGWEIYDLEGGRVLGHDGSTIGQSARLRFVPGLDLAYAILTNGGQPFPVLEALERRILGALAGIEAPSLAAPPQPPVAIDVRRCAGVYQNAAQRLEFAPAEDGGFDVVASPRGAVAELVDIPVKRKALIGYTETSVIDAEPEGGIHWEYAFPELDADGRARYVHMGGRVLVRAADSG